MRTSLYLCLLILSLQAFGLRAQDYIYSVTVGTSWARQQFPAQERLQRKLQSEQPLVLNEAPNFTKTFLDYEHSYRQFNTYNDSIFYPLSHQEWIGMFKRRAVAYSQLYAKDNQDLAIIKDYFTDDNVPDAAYDSLYYWTRHLFFRNVNDIFLFEQMSDILLPHYEELQDIEHLVFCYLCSGMYNYQCSRMGDKESAMRAELYFHKVMNFSDRFASFADPLNRFYVISAYVNLALLYAQSGDVSIRESLDLTNSMKRLYASDETGVVLAADSLLNEYAKWSIDLLRYRGILTYFSRGRDIPALRDQLYQSYCDVRNELGVSSKQKNRYYAKLEYDDILVEAFMGNLSWNEAFLRFDQMLRHDPEFQKGRGVPHLKINYLYNVFESYMLLLGKADFPFDQKRAVVKEHLSTMLDLIARYEHNTYGFEKGQILGNIATDRSLLQYLDTEEKQDLLFRLIVLEQPTTYVHVSMVTDLSAILTEALLDHHPEYFIGMPGIQTAEDAVAQREDLLKYVQKAAIFHDLGKISMPSIINNCFRRLTDHEFDIIQLHPDKSRQFFAIDSVLLPYQDVALGHHKWYDGEGYPARFKNRKSPYFPVICLVTFCDCMDAATENIGRNYHTPRTFESVMTQFEQLSGEQYHPLLVDFVKNNPEIYQKMKLVVNDGRYDNYYKLYLRYMDQKKSDKPQRR